jgi:hypothetical protein
MSSAWPSLPYEAWRDTASTLHLWLQIVGKVALARSPWINHSWHIAFQVTARGLSTRLLEDRGAAFQIEFDFVAHERPTAGRSRCRSSRRRPRRFTRE